MTDNNASVSTREKLHQELKDKIGILYEEPVLEKKIPNERPVAKKLATMKDIQDLGNDIDLEYFKSIIPSPSQNLDNCYHIMKKNCEEYMLEVKADIESAIYRCDKEFLIGSKEEYKVRFAVKVLKRLGYILTQDTRLSGWTESEGKVKKNGYTAFFKTF